MPKRRIRPAPMQRRNSGGSGMSFGEAFGHAQSAYSGAQKVKRIVLPSTEEKYKRLEKKQADREQREEYNQKLQALREKEAEYKSEQWSERKRKLSEMKDKVKGVFTKKKSIYD